MQRYYSHEILVDRPLIKTLPLFTPKGEETWVPGWKPTYIAPDTGETREEMIFATGEGEEATFWTCLKWEPEAGHARYLRFTPGSRVAFVDVQCRPDGAARTRVRVAYQIETLSTAGESFVSGMSESAFVDMIDEWSRLIRNMQ